MDSSLSIDQKVDLLFKKHFNKPYTHINLPFFQEPPIFTRNYVLPNQIWSVNIPNVAPSDLINATLDDLNNTIVNSSVGKTSSEYSIIKKYDKVQLEFLSNSDVMMAFKGPDYSNINILQNSIPFNYDQYSTTYEYKLYKDTGEEILFTQGKWIIDNDSGILTFNEILDGVSESNPPLITFYKYIGDVGLDLRANKSEVYTISQIDQQNININNDLDLKSNLTDIYLRTEIDTFLSNVSAKILIDDDEDTFIKVDSDSLDTDTILFYTNNSHRMSIKQTGNIGINVEEPSELLHIKDGNILMENSSLRINNLLSSDYPLLHLESNNTNQNYNLIFLESNNVTDIRFKSNATNNADWLLGLGKDQSIGGNQSFYIYNYETDNYYLTMEPNTTDPNINGYINIGSNTDFIDLDIRSGGVITSSIKPTRTSSSCLTITQSTDNRCKVGVGIEKPLYDLHVNGTIYAHIISTPSDKRLKKNIRNLDNVLEKIEKLQGVSFEWDSQDILSNKTEIGLIAQEVENIFPEIVYTDQQGLKSMTYDKLTSVLIEAIKELNLKVETLMSQNTSLSNVESKK